MNNFRLPQPIHTRFVYYVNLNNDTKSNYESECICNLMGTEKFDCSCDCITGQCNCDNIKGYTGLLCDDCLSGFYLTYNTTCNGMFDNQTFTFAQSLYVLAYFLECECNLSGTVSGSSSCTDNDGDCPCDIVKGYTGTKCDECLGGWWWLTSNRTCMGNKIDSKVTFIIFLTTSFF